MAIGSGKLIIYTDGGSRGNPGPAAIGVVIEDAKGNPIKKYGEPLGNRTNNEAEYEAVIFALKKAKQLFGGARAKKMQVEFRMDSELIVKQMNNEYKIEGEHLMPLYIKVHNLRMDFGKTVFKHIARDKNKDADKLLNEVLDGGDQGILL